MKPVILGYDGDGEFRAPSPYWRQIADKEYVVGELYQMITHEDRSQASHSHYFAVINEAWRSLPDNLLPEYPTSEHLRKKMLVKTGYHDERSIVCINGAAARKTAAFVQPLDQYAVVLVERNIVRVYTAQSQSHKAMGRRAFAESKDKVLNAVEDLLGADRGSAEAAA